MLDTLVRHLSMVRLSVSTVATVATLMVAVQSAACTGSVTGGGGGNDTTVVESAARKKFIDEALPKLAEASCTTCHGSSATGYLFLSGNTPEAIYDTLMNFPTPVVNLEVPGSSRILSKGQHSGQPLNGTQIGPILEWLQAEAQERDIGGPGDGVQLESGKLTLQLCTQATVPCPVNIVALDDVGLAGAKITFTAEALQTGLYVSEFALVGGPTNGAFIKHPLVVSWNGDTPVPDSLDRYFDTEVNAGPDETVQIGGGTAVFVGFDARSQVSLHFKLVEPFHPGNVIPDVGCKALAQFTAAAKPTLMANCTGGNCHNQSDSARGNMDLITIGDASMDGETCKQALSRVNKDQPDNSGLFLAPMTGSGTTHPIKLAAGTFNTYKTAMMVWINAEITAQ